MEEERDVGIRLWEEISQHLRDEEEMVVVNPDLTIDDYWSAIGR